MKHEKPQLTSGETSLLPETTTENTTAAAQRENPPGLATALFHWMVPPGSPVSRGLKRISTGRCGQHEPAGALSAQSAQFAGERLRFKSLKKKVPTRLVVAILLLIAAVITGLFAPRPH
ncbi:hypothetical protein WB91_08575 [bacteria symbiont BFo1 of Frankliniella occidentalis]|uniref:hypothetical protein n=1 Tax=Erwinia aphidicola TaxID=68334 RepID=UPI000789E857|nr:hypothetical protein [Erwinia aphidicola]KYP90550.1 hypothetical protein WB91_08575 [bacteria symbiont BFo1 of Frankliniella occidentalis]CAH0298204.1 hypothetical protein SRABI13_04293 [Erwinia aphidicola]